MTTTETRIDGIALDEMVERAVGYVMGAAVTAAIVFGDRLGLYQAMTESNPSGLTSDELASMTGTHPRLIREWLDGQAAAGLVAYDAALDRYALSDEAATVLAVEDSPVFLGAGAGVFAVPYLDMDRVESAFRSDGALPWKDHDGSLFTSTGRHFRPSYLNFLTKEWIPALDGVSERLTEEEQWPTWDAAPVTAPSSSLRHSSRSRSPASTTTTAHSTWPAPIPSTQESRIG